MKQIQERTDSQTREAIRRWEHRLVVFALACSPVLFFVGWIVVGMLLNSLLYLQPITGIQNAATSRIAIIAGSLFAALPTLWWLSLRIENDRFRIDGVLTVAMTAALICGCSLLLDHPRCRFVLEEAVKARAPQLNFVRNVTFKQQQLRTPETFSDGLSEDVILLVGSSQINLGIDTQRLSAQTSDSRVVSVCMPGMVPVQYLALANDLLGQRPTHVICWVSEFDFFRESELPTTRLRWCMNQSNYQQLIGILDPVQKVQQRSQLADLGLASVCTVWQQRDLLQMVGYRFWWKWNSDRTSDGQIIDADEVAIGGRLVDKEQGIENVRNNVSRTSMVDANFLAFDRFAQLMDDAGIKVLVIEGELHPDAMKAYPAEIRVETRTRLQSMSAQNHHFTYVTQFDRPTFLESEWRDAVHFNELGREKLTQFVAQQVLLIP